MTPHNINNFTYDTNALSSIYSLSLHDALPICQFHRGVGGEFPRRGWEVGVDDGRAQSGDHRPIVRDRKSTRLNSSHVAISYAVFCLKKKKTISCIEQLMKLMRVLLKLIQYNK